MAFHWAYDEDGIGQPVEKLADDKVLIIGCAEPMTEGEAGFVWVDPHTIAAHFMPVDADKTD